MGEIHLNQELEKKLVGDDLRQDYENTLTDRIRRHLEVKPCPIIAGHHFSYVSSECFRLFRDGHFYGCIALTQAVAEALVRFLCNRNDWKPNKVFEKNLEKLVERNFISEEIRSYLNQIWKERDDYHHLNTTIENNHKKLEKLARKKLEFLNEVESEIFNHNIVNGVLCPINPKYWDIVDGKAPAYIRCG
ncbi:MAG: hypothetical protein KAJ46_03435 [Sedimentisphaerales bacterium]|nr:hypothetical protein [Sedimentisphaerales bacterium]